MELKITQAIRDIEREMASSDDLDKFEKSMADKLKIAKYEIIDEIRKMKNGN